MRRESPLLARGSRASTKEGSTFAKRFAAIAAQHPNRQIPKKPKRQLEQQKIFLANANFYFPDNITFGHCLQWIR